MIDSISYKVSLASTYKDMRVSKVWECDDAVHSVQNVLLYLNKPSKDIAMGEPGTKSFYW